MRSSAKFSIIRFSPHFHIFASYLKLFSYMGKENIRIMCMRWNYLLKRRRKNSLRADPSSPLHPSIPDSGSEDCQHREANGENGKYCASYYLFTYLHFSSFILHSVARNAWNKKEGKVSSRDDLWRHGNCPLGASCSASSVTKFHKLETAERVFLSLL